MVPFFGPQRTYRWLVIDHILSTCFIIFQSLTEKWRRCYSDNSDVAERLKKARMSSPPLVASGLVHHVHHLHTEGHMEISDESGTRTGWCHSFRIFAAIGAYVYVMIEIPLNLLFNADRDTIQ